MIDTKSSYAYCQCVALELILNELWPLDFFIYITYMDISSEHYISATLDQNLKELHKNDWQQT